LDVLASWIKVKRNESIVKSVKSININGYAFKFAIAIAYDAIDFFSIPVLGQIYDVIGIPLGYILWGPLGLTNAWELLDPVDTIDRFVPTMTLAGVVVYLKEKGDRKVSDPSDYVIEKEIELYEPYDDDPIKV